MPLFQSGIRSDRDKKVKEQQQSQREACNSENQLGGQELVARAAQEVGNSSGGKFIVETSPHNQAVQPSEVSVLWRTKEKRTKALVPYDGIGRRSF